MEILNNKEESVIPFYIEMREHVLRIILRQYRRFMFNAEIATVF